MRKILLSLILAAGFYIGSMLPVLAAPPDPSPFSPASAAPDAAALAPADSSSPGLDPASAAVTDSLFDGSAPPESIQVLTSGAIEHPPVPLKGARTTHLLSGRALWVKRDQLVSPERIVRLVDEAADNGYTILFVQVRGRGDAWYQSEIVPRAGQIARATYGGGPWDPLDFLLRHAHARQLEVHAWVNMFLVWSDDQGPMNPAHVLNAHPEWVAVDARGRRLSDYSEADYRRANIEGAFLAAGNPEVRQHLRRVIAEIAVKYPVDGIHLDYVRNPRLDAGYDAASRAAFMAESGVDPWELRRAPAVLEARFGREGVATLERRWDNWRAAQVTRLVSLLRSDLDQLDRPVTLSAAVFPNVETAAADVGQDWARWCQNGYMDLVVPMFYSTDMSVVMRQLRAALRQLPDGVILYAGIAVYNQPLAAAARKAVEARQAGAAGVSFFPYDTLAEKPGSLRQLTRLTFGT